MQFQLIFDGGSLGNPGKAYGSYSIKRGGGAFRKPVRCDFGRGTNNEAEYRSLIEGLRGILAEAEQEDIPLKEINLVLRGDSQLVLNQVEGVWKAKNPRMRILRDQARELLRCMGAVTYEHHDRSLSVEILGH
ncbi:MAG: ribonuclease HI family protein [Anaerolineales bacterium]|nr:ribonuclease HI family protein [Anaerolineales bacterium]